MATNVNISSDFDGCDIERIPKKLFKSTPKKKTASDFIRIKYLSGEERFYSGYNIIEEELVEEEGSMTKSEFEKLYADLSAKTEQRISDMLTTKFDQMEQKRLADKAEIKQEINEFKSEIKQEINDFKVEMNQKFDNFKVEIRTEINEFKIEIRTEMNQKFDLVFSTMESNQAQTNNRLDRIEQDIKMLKSFHEEDIKKYNEQNEKEEKDKGKDKSNNK